MSHHNPSESFHRLRHSESSFQSKSLKLSTRNQSQYNPQEDEPEIQSSFQAPQRPHHETSTLHEASPLLNFTLFYGLIFSVLGFLIIILISIYELRLSLMPELSPGPFQYISENLKADPILDIQILDNESSCPLGFEPLVLNTWPGTLDGCLCQNGALVASTCQQLNSQQCKSDIPSTNPVDMHAWRGSIWCGKRAVLENDYIKKAVCPSENKECYPGGCFIKDCPITKVEISSTQTNNKLSKQGSDGKERYIILTRTQGEMPLIAFKITPNDMPCFDQNVLQSPIYPLLNVTEKENCGKYGLDSSFSVGLDSQSSYQSFIENSFPQNIMDLPHFQTNSQQSQSILSWRIKMKTAQKEYCFDFNAEYLSTSIEALNSYTGHFLLLSSLTGAFLVFFLSSCRFALRFYENFDFKCTARELHFRAGLSLLIYFLVLLQFIKLNSLYKAIKSDQEYLQKYKSLGCFVEGQSGVVISDYLGILKIVENSHWLSLVLFTLNSLLIVLWVSYFVSKTSSTSNRRNPL